MYIIHIFGIGFFWATLYVKHLKYTTYRIVAGEFHICSFICNIMWCNLRAIDILEITFSQECIRECIENI